MAALLWLETPFGALGLLIGPVAPAEAPLLLDGVVVVGSSPEVLTALHRRLGDLASDLFLVNADNGRDLCLGMIEPVVCVHRLLGMHARVAVVATGGVETAFVAASVLVFAGMSPPAAIELVQTAVPTAFATIEDEIGPSAFREYLTEWRATSRAAVVLGEA